MMQVGDPRVILDGERHALDVLAQRLGGDPVIFDVGANVGDYTREVIKRFPKAKITCFEPQPFAAKCLREWAKKESVALGVEQVALSDTSGQMTLRATEHPACYCAGLYRDYDKPSGRPFDREETVKTTTLDVYCAEHAIERINLLKVDVEGHEPSVIAGGSLTLAQGVVDTIQWEMADVAEEAGWTFDDMRDMLLDLGFRTFLEDGAALREITEPTGEFDGLTHYVNMLSVSRDCAWWTD